MNKPLTILATALVSCSLAACGSNNHPNHSANSAKTTKVHKKYYFDGKTANLKDEKITISKVQFYQGDEATSGKNLIVFDYTITNKSDKDIDAITGWQAVFNAYQNNKNTEGKLEVGPLPADTSSKVLHIQDQTIKKGGKVKCRAAYQLDSTSKPVVLKAVKGSDGNFLGKKTFKIKKFKSNELASSSSSQQEKQQNSAGSSAQQSADAQQSSDQRPDGTPSNFKEYTAYTSDGHKMTQWNDAGHYLGDPDTQYNTIQRQTEAGF